jgi:hypothetical protein
MGAHRTPWSRASTTVPEVLAGPPFEPGCDKKLGFDAERHEMRTRHTPGITRRDAEQLLGGAAGSGPDRLIHVMNAATAPAREGELAGEQAAMAAFEASPPFEARPLSRSAAHRKRKMPTLPFLNLLSMKAVAWSLAGLAAAGGAATAGTVAFSGSGSTPAGNPGASLPVVGSAGTAAPGAATGDGVTAPANPSPSAGSPDAVALTPARLCAALTSKVESVVGNAEDGTGPAGLSSVLANPAVTQVLATAPFNGLLTAAGGASAVPDYCGLLLDLPTVPVPGAFTQLPASVLNQALTALPAGELGSVLTTLPVSSVTGLLPSLPTSDLTQVMTTLPNAATGTILSELPAAGLTQVLTALPSAALGNVFTGLPTSDLSDVLTTLPSSSLGTVLTALPAANLGDVLTQLPAGNLGSVLSALPEGDLSSVLGTLPAGDLSSVMSTLPSSTVGSLMSSLPSGAASQILGRLPAPVLNGLRGALPSSLLALLPL